ncbi:hypothetical protein FBU31_007283 [Coemansia sp. 'formosensis']|nr:hypothetical protein FBU31_007283 [Coemansia sp. 'formosensis']
MTQIVGDNTREDSSDAFSDANEIFDKVAEWLDLDDQEFSIKFGLHSSLDSDDFVDVVLNDVTLAKCKPPGDSPYIYLKIEVGGELQPRFRNRSFKLILSRYK